MLQSPPNHVPSLPWSGLLSVHMLVGEKAGEGPFCSAEGHEVAVVHDLSPQPNAVAIPGAQPIPPYRYT